MLVIKKMRVVLGLCLLVLGVVAEVKPRMGYIKEVAIPLAESIKSFEDSIHLGAEVDERSKTNVNFKIVGGVTSNVNAHPYLGGLIINFVGIAGQGVCGSTLLSTSRLVTAAHCWNDGWNQASMFTVVLGSQFLFWGGTRVVTTNVIMHPQWTPSTFANDIAMIILPTNVVYSTSIQPMALPVSSLWDQFIGEWGLAAGYGRTSDLQASVTTATFVSEVRLQVISVAQCQAIFGWFAQASTICTNGAGGVGICGGDSGGPLFINRNGQNVLVGVSSFVAQDGCQLGYPSAFARVTSFYSFIMQYL